MVFGRLIIMDVRACLKIQFCYSAADRFALKGKLSQYIAHKKLRPQDIISLYLRKAILQGK